MSFGSRKNELKYPERKRGVDSELFFLYLGNVYDLEAVKDINKRI